MSNKNYVGTSFDEMTTEEMEDIFGGVNETVQPQSVVASLAGSALLTFVGSYLVTAVFCK